MLKSFYFNLSCTFKNLYTLYYVNFIAKYFEVFVIGKL